MFGKILVGALVGVGAVAAAPFTGGGSIIGAASLAASLTGAGTIAAAIGAGSVGAGVGVKFAKNEKDQRKMDIEAGKEKGKNEVKMKYSRKTEELTNEIKRMLEEQKNDSFKHEQMIVCLYAVGICAANCDGVICDEELDEIDVLAAGIAASEIISEPTKQTIEKMRQSPPNLKSVIAMLNKHGFNKSKDIQKFSLMIEVVILADGKTEEMEKSFLKAWHTETKYAA